MGYETGTIYNFKNRLHQTPTGIYDLNLYLAEATGYVPFLTTGNWHELNYWNKEFIKKYEIFDSPSGNFSL